MNHIAVARAGITMARSSTEEPVDVRFDDHSVWAFNLKRDGHQIPTGLRVAWPKALVPYLDGRTRVTLVGHTSKSVLYDAEVAFTPADRRVQVTDSHGNLLTVDKGGRMQRDFTNTDESTRELIVGFVDRVLQELRDEAGLDAFLAYGCLLGAVRDGHMIGHDADADVAYLSRYSHPFDIARENRRAVRAMRGLGHQVVEMSAADFKIWLPLPDGRRCGIDVFGGYEMNGDFFLLPTVHGTLDRSALLPQGSVVLEGRPVPAPARPEELLAVTYGPSWRVPDPSFKYEHPVWLNRHMDGYWRGFRNHLRDWDTFYKSGAAGVPRKASPFARWTQAYLANRLDELDAADPVDVVDVGTGTGRDALFFARKGHRVLALDYSPHALAMVRRAARRTALPVEARRVNLNDVRSTLPLAAQLAQDPRPRHVYARLVLDGLSAPGRRELLRFASMVSRRGGRTFLEFREGRRADLGRVGRDVVDRGGAVEHQERGTDLAPYADKNPVVCRMVVRWER